MWEFLRGLTVNQWFAIIIAILSALAGATAQLNDLFGVQAGHSIVTAATLLTTIMSSILVSLTSQGAQIRNVNAMQGIEKILVNKDANQTLAQIAIDPSTKVQPTPNAEAAVAETAHGKP